MSTDSLTNQNVGAFGDSAQAIGAMSSGITQMKNSQSAAKADTYNATIANQNATAVGQQTALKTQQLAMAAGQNAGVMRAAAGQSGTGSGGTNALVLRQSETNADLNEMVNDYAGQMKRAQFANQAGLDVYQAKNAKANSLDFLAAGATSATSRLLQGFMRYQKNGTPMPMNNGW